MMAKPGTSSSVRLVDSPSFAVGIGSVRCATQCPPSRPQSPCRHLARAASTTAFRSSSAVVTLELVLDSHSPRRTGSPGTGLNFVLQRSHQEVGARGPTCIPRGLGKWREIWTLESRCPTHELDGLCVV